MKTHWETVAKRKAGNIDGWEWCEVRAVGKDRSDMIIEGGVPNVGVPRSQKWRGIKTETVVVTQAEEAAEYARYEQETGRCGKCMGEGREMAAWHHNRPAEYRPCPVCKGAGFALEVARPKQAEKEIVQ